MSDALDSDLRNEESPHISVAGEEARKRLAARLASATADTYLLLAKTQGYHWNVAGPLFVSIHELTEEQYQDLFEAADDLAERIRALGEPSPGSYRQFAEISAIEEDDGSPKTAKQMVEALAHDNELVARRMKAASDIAEELGDKVTEDMLIDRMQQHEQNAWMLRAIAADEPHGAKH
ncbi:MAG: DNA starvation/stationary phase protection protein [Oceanicaulis sp.]